MHAIGSARIFSLITDIRISKEEVLLDSRARYQGHMEIKSLKARKLGAKATDGMQNLGLTATSSLACLYTEPWSSLHCMTVHEEIHQQDQSECLWTSCGLITCGWADWAK